MNTCLNGITSAAESLEIKGDPQLSRTVASLKEFQKGDEAFYVELGMINVKGEVPGLGKVLEDYVDLCEVAELPPHRCCDYSIEIKEGSQIPNIRPYL